MFLMKNVGSVVDIWHGSLDGATELRAGSLDHVELRRLVSIHESRTREI